MSLDQQRIDIVTEIERAKDAWNAGGNGYQLKVEYDNRSTVDLAALTSPYLMVDIVWGKSDQLDLGSSPLVCDYGQIILAAGAKEGQGTAGLLKLLQFYRPYLQLRSPLGSVRTQAAVMGLKPILQGGYYYQTLMVPFWSIEAAPAVP
jgi:hypothetical protein